MHFGTALDRTRRRKVAARYRHREALVDRYVAAPDPVENAQRIVGAARHLDIAVDRRHGKELKRRI
jgi:hypothetical protein